MALRRPETMKIAPGYASLGSALGFHHSSNDRSRARSQAMRTRGFSEEIAMYCPNCAAPFDGVKFCRSCGSNVSLVPQAMSGQLPQSDDAEDERHRGHRHRRKKEPTVESAVTEFFAGIGFVVAAIGFLVYVPKGEFWEWLLGWSMLIPAFVLIGEGVGKYLRWKEHQRKQTSLKEPENQPGAYQSPSQTPALSAPTTSELVKPSSVAEQTTRHLESSRQRE